MTRVIKYNAWDTERKKMFYSEELGQDELTLNPDGRGFVNVSGTNTKLSQYMKHLIPLEFTRLKDKNKKDIYDQDIVEFEYADFTKSIGKSKIIKGIGVVEFVDWLGAWCIIFGTDEFMQIKLGRVIFTKKGNKYDNPELLKRELKP